MAQLQAVKYIIVTFHMNNSVIVSLKIENTDHSIFVCILWHPADPDYQAENHSSRIFFFFFTLNCEATLNLMVFFVCLFCFKVLHHLCSCAFITMNPLGEDTLRETPSDLSSCWHNVCKKKNLQGHTLSTQLDIRFVLKIGF